MKIEKEKIKYIKVAFAEMESREGFLSLLNYAKPILFGDKTVPFKLQQITYYANPWRSKKAYKEFQIKKKSGGVRTIYAPNNGLKAIQKTLALVLQCVFSPHEAAKGFVMGKSIVDNAKEHTRQNYVYNIDLKDFFPSIDQARVWACLKLEPFNLIDKNSSKELSVHDIETGIRKFTTDHQEEIYYIIKKGQIKLINDKKGNYSRLEERLKNHGIEVLDEVVKLLSIKKHVNQIEKLVIGKNSLANLIASLSCTQMLVERKNKEGEWVEEKRNVLPQGAPTSPIFSNVVCQKIDKRLSGVAKKFNLKYTRYADDITFSSMHNVYQENSAFLKELHRIIADQNFEIKESKTRLQKSGYRQEVTGLVVNDSVNVRKRYVKQVRMWLYYWEKYGFNKAESIFLRDYFIDKGHIKKAKPNFKNVLSGKLEYLKMVKGLNNSTYLSLNNRFEKLNRFKNPLEVVLLEWENKGIKSAMNLYKFSDHE